MSMNNNSAEGSVPLLSKADLFLHGKLNRYASTTQRGRFYAWLHYLVHEAAFIIAERDRRGSPSYGRVASPNSAAPEDQG